MKASLEQQGLPASRTSCSGSWTDVTAGYLPAASHPMTSGEGRWVYPYLLRDLTITRATQVWARRGRLTYLPMARGFLYLVADTMYWHEPVRDGLGTCSNTLETGFCAEALTWRVTQRRKDGPTYCNTDAKEASSRSRRGGPQIRPGSTR